MIEYMGFHFMAQVNAGAELLFGYSNARKPYKMPETLRSFKSKQPKLMS
jgi:hypothetical protein